MTDLRSTISLSPEDEEESHTVDQPNQVPRATKPCESIEIVCTPSDQEIDQNKESPSMVTSSSRKRRLERKSSLSKSTIRIKPRHDQPNATSLNLRPIEEDQPQSFVNCGEANDTTSRPVKLPRTSLLKVPGIGPEGVKQQNQRNRAITFADCKDGDRNAFETTEEILVSTCKTSTKSESDDVSQQKPHYHATAKLVQIRTSLVIPTLINEGTAARSNESFHSNVQEFHQQNGKANINSCVPDVTYPPQTHSSSPSCKKVEITSPQPKENSFYTETPSSSLSTRKSMRLIAKSLPPVTNVSSTTQNQEMTDFCQRLDLQNCAKIHSFLSNSSPRKSMRRRRRLTSAPTTTRFAPIVVGLGTIDNDINKQEPTLRPDSTAESTTTAAGTAPHLWSTKRSISVLLDKSSRASKESSTSSTAVESLIKPHTPEHRRLSTELRKIAHKVVTAFGNVINNIIEPCLSSTIFAAFLLSLEDRHISTQDPVVQCVLPYLQSLVKAEAVSLRGWVPGRDADKSVDFCAYDYSTALPPVDRVQGSGTDQEDLIEALREAKIQIEHLFSPQNDEELRNKIKQSLSELLGFLESPGTKWLGTCALSIGKNFPVKRVEGAVQLYRNEITAILSRFNSSSSTCSLCFEKRLAESVGQAIRYRLRLLLLPAPPRLTRRLLLSIPSPPPALPRLIPRDEEYDCRWSQRHSQFHNKIILRMEDSNAKAVDDDRLAALFTSALDVLCEFFGLEQLMDTDFSVPNLPLSFCQSLASQRDINRHGSSIKFTDEELKDVFDDIEEATDILLLKGASSFLYDLLALQPVQQEINRQGGWDRVETYARYGKIYRLWDLIPSDKHLVVLCDVRGFFTRLCVIVNALQAPSLAAKESLNALTTRLRLKTKSDRLLTRHPEIKMVAKFITESHTYAYTFPTVLRA